MEVTDCTIGHKSLLKNMIGVFVARKNQDLPKSHLQQFDQIDLRARKLRASLILEEALKLINSGLSLTWITAAHSTWVTPRLHATERHPPNHSQAQREQKD